MAGSRDERREAQPPVRPAGLDPRGADEPLFGHSRMKLGVFGTNVDYGCTITRVPEHFAATWDNARRIAVLADRAGFDAVVPVARWKGFGGATDFNGTCFETFTWAAGLAEATERIAVFSTCHVPTVHPVVAAKQAATIDHISGGRFGLNVVCGWNEDEFDMFGRPMMDHATRYAYAAEWLEVVRLLWTRSEPFDYEGVHLRVRSGTSKPKPVRRPHPPVMNAGNSEDGRRFMAQNCEMAFVAFSETTDPAEVHAKLGQIRTLAAAAGRRVQIWTNTNIVCRPTEAEARAYIDRCFRDYADPEAIHNLAAAHGLAEPPPRMIPGWGGYPVVGSPQQVVDTLLRLSAWGIDGCLLSWVDYDDGVARWTADVTPLLVEAGLREPVPQRGRDAALADATGGPGRLSRGAGAEAGHQT